ncbi:MAG: aminotransferase class V-fold PLP-dependent enzyme [Candidatus Latescibacteria bacterium]|nr:aminotransferase class V-fold PLP-dependent enzyme [Candidatus Latescibacterota bacterium]
MSRHNDIEHVSSTSAPNLGRRRFLKTAGGAAAVSGLLASTGFPAAEAAVASAAGMTPFDSARDESLWGAAQQAFSMNRSLINLDNAWTCPSPRVVTEAVVRYIWNQEEVPAQQWINDFEDRVETVRISLGRQLDCDPQELAIVRNATEALKTVLYGVPLKAGDEVLTTNHDYSSLVSVIRHREIRDGIKLVRAEVPAPAESMDQLVSAFEEAITPRTKLILVSHIAYLTGQIFPVKRICEMAHQRDIEVVVDAAHSFAHLDYTMSDLQGDYFGTSLHKWMLAPKGTGLLYIPKDKIEKINPLMSGPSRRRGRSIRKYESVGTQSMAPMLAIGEAITFHRAIGGKVKEERMRYLKLYWAERLNKLSNIQLYTSLDPEMSCGFTTVGIRGVHPEALRDYLWEQHYIQTARIDRGEDLQGLRTSPNLYTTLPELDYFCEVMEEVAANGMPEPYRSMTFERDF